MKRKSYRIIYIATSIILNIVLAILEFIPFIIALNIAASEGINKGIIKQPIEDRLQGVILMIFIAFFWGGINFGVYKLMQKKANLKLIWSTIPFITLIITSILIYAFFTFFLIHH